MPGIGVDGFDRSGDGACDSAGACHGAQRSSSARCAADALALATGLATHGRPGDALLHVVSRGGRIRLRRCGKRTGRKQNRSCGDRYEDRGVEPGSASNGLLSSRELRGANVSRVRLPASFVGGAIQAEGRFLKPPCLGHCLAACGVLAQRLRVVILDALAMGAKKPDGLRRPVRVALQEGGGSPPRELAQRAAFLAGAAASLAAFRLLRVRSPNCSAVFCATPNTCWPAA